MSQPSTVAPTGGRTAGLVLLGMAATLAAMALAVLVLGLMLHRTATDFCADDLTGMPECLLATRDSQQQLRTIWLVALTLGAGAGTATVVGGLLLRLRR